MFVFYHIAAEKGMVFFPARGYRAVSGSGASSRDLKSKEGSSSILPANSLRSRLAASRLEIAASTAGRSASTSVRISLSMHADESTADVRLLHTAAKSISFRWFRILVAESAKLSSIDGAGGICGYSLTHEVFSAGGGIAGKFSSTFDSPVMPFGATVARMPRLTK